MGFMVPKRSILLLFLIFAAHLPASFAGDNRKLLDRSVAGVEAGMKDASANKVAEYEEEIFLGRSRILAVKTNSDYGNYDPTPAFSKPPFKLIPN